MDEILWHYTTKEGLLGILESRRLWATDARYLNDSQELKLGFEELREVLRERLEGDPTESSPEARARGVISRSFLQDVHRSYLERLLSLLESHEDLTVYVTCFCADGDLLSQWRGYAAGGFALGFDRADLGSIRPEDLGDERLKLSLHVALQQVAYFGPQDHGLIKVLTSRLDTLNTTPWHNTPLAVDVDYGSRVLPELASKKHAAFCEEQEYRLIVTESRAFPDHDCVGVRPGPYGLTPYMKIPFPSKALKQIRVGPGPNQQLNSRALKHLLKGDLQHVEVTQSWAPYKG